MIYCNEKPSVFEKVGDGSIRYYYNMNSVEKVDDETGESRTEWRCDDVVVWLPLSANKFIRAIIDKKWGNGVEEKLINEFNAAQLGLIGGSVDSTEAIICVENYRNFLIERAALKAQVEKDYSDNINNL